MRLALAQAAACLVAGCLALPAPAAAQGGPAQAAVPQEAPPQETSPQETRPQETPPQGSLTPAAPPPALQPCGAKAARYEGEKGFTVSVTRLGRATPENPLRPLTPEVTQVLQVTIAGKPATAYGSDLSSLRRGGAPAALAAQLGAPVTWEPALPELPDPLAIVGEDGTPLATLRFRDCTDPPAVRAEPAAARRERKAAPRAAKPAAKAPPGFSVPQGAIAE